MFTTSGSMLRQLPIAAALLFSSLGTIADAAAPGIPTYFLGTYKVGAQKGIIDLQVVEAVPAGSFFVGWITVDGTSYLSQMQVTGRKIDAFWFDPADDTQTPLGTVSGMVSRDGTAFDGTLRIGRKKGKCSMLAG